MHESSLFFSKSLLEKKEEREKTIVGDLWRIVPTHGRLDILWKPAVGYSLNPWSNKDELKTKNKTQLIIKDLSSKNLFFFNSLLFPKEKREKRFWRGLQLTSRWDWSQERFTKIAWRSSPDNSSGGLVEDSVLASLFFQRKERCSQETRTKDWWTKTWNEMSFDN